VFVQVAQDVAVEFAAGAGDGDGVIGTCWEGRRRSLCGDDRHERTWATGVPLLGAPAAQESD
jgi:hypothetical protein